MHLDRRTQVAQRDDGVLTVGVVEVDHELTARDVGHDGEVSVEKLNALGVPVDEKPIAVDAQSRHGKGRSPAVPRIIDHITGKNIGSRRGVGVGAIRERESRPHRSDRDTAGRDKSPARNRCRL